jgi:hypothetical protein
VAELAGDDRGFHEVAYQARQDVLRDVLAADLSRLANVFVQVCERRPSLPGLHPARAS